VTVLVRAIVFACLTLDLAAPPHAGAVSRSLSIRYLSAGKIEARGSGWGRGPVVLSVTVTPWIVGVLVKPAASGSFEVVVKDTSQCEAIALTATDTHGHRVAASRPAPGCPPPPKSRPPRISVLKGVRIRPTIASIVLPHPQLVSIHVAQEIYLWEPGATAPMFRPTVDSKYLAVIRQGMTQARPCARADCGQGYFWRWIAVHPGDTGITLSAACRQATPPCMIPDYLIRVHITP